jgi:prevent-host-death family protein
VCALSALSPCSLDQKSVLATFLAGFQPRSSYNDYRDHDDHLGGFLKQTIWTVAEAKARLSEVLDQALSQGPQTITRSGRVTAIVVSSEEWERKTKRVGNLAEFFAASPLRGSELEIERVPDRPRKSSRL